MNPPPKKRWAVLAVFGNGQEVVLRDFYLHLDAANWLASNGNRDFYPDRKYELELRQIEIIQEREG